MNDYYVRAEIEIRVRATCEDDASEKVKQDTKDLKTGRYLIITLKVQDI